MSLRLHQTFWAKKKIRLLTCLFACVFAVGIQSKMVLAQAASEPDLRAAIIYRLLQYSQWAFIDDTQLQLCTKGNGEGAEAFQKLNGEHLRNEVSISVHKLQNDNLAQCDVVILGPEDEVALTTEFEENFIICNGCEKNVDISALNLFRKNDRLLYDVNLTASERNELHFKSAILKSAHRVWGGQ